MSFFEGYQQTGFFDFPELSFPAVTDDAEVYVKNYLSTRNYTLLVTVSNIDTSVVVRLDGTTDDVNYGAMISNTITANGTYAYNVSGFPMKKVRGNFLYEYGGTNAIVKFQIAAN